MKRTFICLLLLAAGPVQVCGSCQPIACGTQPGEVYFVGPHPTLLSYSGLYYSADYGQHIDLRDSVSDSNYDNYGCLLADKADSTLYRLSEWPLYGQYLSDDGGNNWQFINAMGFAIWNYAAGVTPGEVYRPTEDPYRLQLERSTTFGQEYTSCSTVGIPDSLFIEDLALGREPGQVYIWAFLGNLFYSSDTAEHFAFVDNLYQSWGIPPSAGIINGAQAGEVFAYHYDSQSIWRVYDYGDSVALIANFPYILGWGYGLAASRQPGELYLWAVLPNMYPGGVIQIYHTVNYCQDWTMYEHVIPYESVEKQVSIVPFDMSLQTWPNPANAFFNIAYSLPQTSKINLGLFNILGKAVWQFRKNSQTSGIQQLSIGAETLPSGEYILMLQTPEGHIAKPLTILK